MRRVIDRVSYDTNRAICIADDRYWDGHNFEHGGRNCYLYKTKKGRYFFVTTSLWQGEHDTLTACSVDEAIDFFEQHPEHANVDWSEAFPEEEIEEA